jgi:hypothetical protein
MVGDVPMCPSCGQYVYTSAHYCPNASFTSVFTLVPPIGQPTYAELQAEIATLTAREAVMVRHLKKASIALDEADRLAPTDEDGEGFQAVQSGIDEVLHNTSPRAEAMLRCVEAARNALFQVIHINQCIELQRKMQHPECTCAHKVLQDALAELEGRSK